MLADARRRVLVEQVDGDEGRPLLAELGRERRQPVGALATSTSEAPGSRARRRAVASPIPLEAPVMRITESILRLAFQIADR